MTNNWTDIGNATFILVMGANPAENHPASFYHINKARAGANGHPQADLWVVDPRQTRTARQASRYIRIRPGTDIAFVMGLVNQIIARVGNNPQVKANFDAYLNHATSRTYTDDAGNDVAVTDSSKYTDARVVLNAAGTDYNRIVRTVGTQTITNFPEMAATYDAVGVATVFNKLKDHVTPYTPAVVADICGCTAQDVTDVADKLLANCRHSSFDPAAPTTIIHDPKSPYFRVSTHMYAMGLTQHTYGSQNVKSFAVLQTLLGNVGRPGGGINALRGIHNVQGSTDMGLLFGNIPAYSANPTKMPYGTLPSGVDANGFGKYMDALYGNRVSSGAAAGSYDNAYLTTKMGLQQRGFYNMTRAWFGPGVSGRDSTDHAYALWPKGQGDDHITAFRKMASGTTKALVCWGENPAVSEPNQSWIRTGIENLDLLVVVDMFENETAAAKRKATGVTYLIPAASHVEEAGSCTNSGRLLQWRERARLPKGNSRSDLELLLRFAKAIDDNSGFSHIQSKWTAAAGPGVAGGLGWVQGTDFVSVYDKLYGIPYGWTPGAGDFESVSGTAEVWRAGQDAPQTTTVSGSEWVAEKLYREMNSSLANGGTTWIYLEAYDTVTSARGGGWQLNNRAKSRDNRDLDSAGGDHLLFKNWGYAWLVNRRVLYNNSDTPWDQADGFQGPEQWARFFVSTNAGVIDYGKNYRSVHRLSDRPDVVLTGSNPASPHFISAGYSLAGRFPGHTEPYESPRTDLTARWGRNTRGTAAYDLLKADSVAAAQRVGDPDPSLYPLVLTTIRAVEHFQGGVMTRNNAWNSEAEPEPWIEINPVDARANGINNGDWVNIITARSDSIAGQEGRSQGNPGFAKGFRARVDNGVSAYQRVGPGVVAIPWHWGDRGLVTGSRANDLCIDAFDANTIIPESKACLCRIEKA